MAIGHHSRWRQACPVVRVVMGGSRRGSSWLATIVDGILELTGSFNVGQQLASSQFILDKFNIIGPSKPHIVGFVGGDSIKPMNLLFEGRREANLLAAAAAAGVVSAAFVVLGHVG